jgi:hypothetical protein
LSDRRWGWEAEGELFVRVVKAFALSKFRLLIRWALR